MSALATTAGRPRAARGAGPARTRAAGGANGRAPAAAPHVGVHVSTAGGLLEALRRARAMRLSAIQLFTSSPRRWAARPLTADEAARFRAERAAAGIRAAFAHDSYLVRIGHREPALLRRSLASFLSEMGRAAALGLDGVVIHPCAYPGCPPDEAVLRVSEALNRIVALQPPHGPRILLETAASGPFSRFDALADLLARLEPASRFGACLDTCHVFAAGHDLRTPATYAATWRAFDATVGRDRLHLVHANDSRDELGSRRDRHAHVGEGRLGRAAFSLLMRDPALVDVPKVCELPKVRDGVEMDPVNVGRLRRLAQGLPAPQPGERVRSPIPAGVPAAAEGRRVPVAADGGRRGRNVR
jgi:deoxyribonuclease-4